MKSASMYMGSKSEILMSSTVRPEASSSGGLCLCTAVAPRCEGKHGSKLSSLHHRNTGMKGFSFPRGQLLILSSRARRARRWLWSISRSDVCFGLSIVVMMWRAQEQENKKQGAAIAMQCCNTLMPDALKCP